MVNESERLVASYLEGFGLLSERFSKQETRKGKTPDFRVLKNGALAFFCEVKNAQEDCWLDEQAKNAEPGMLYGGLRDDPVYNRIANHIHRAAKQFKAANPDRTYPNLLALVNEDRMAGFPDLRSVLTGNFYSEDGSVEPMFRYLSEGRIREERFCIDLYLWFDVGRQKPHMLFAQSNPTHEAALCGYLDVRLDRIKSVAPE